MPVGVVTVGRLAELDRAGIGLVGGHEPLGQLGAAAQHNDEQPGGVGIQRAAVADFLDPKLAPDGVHHIVRSGAGWLVNQDRAVEWFEFVHGLKIPLRGEQ